MRDLRYEVVRRAFRLPRPRVRDVERRKDLKARMSDGVELLADHYVPVGVTEPPLVLMRSPYGRRGAAGIVARVLAHEGFQVVIQSCRGTEGSGGQFDRPFRCESADGRDTVAWLREQPFYPGRFATFCGSYLGYVQLALPPESKAELFAAVLQITPSRTQDVVWPDGGLALATTLGWAASANRNDTSIRGTIAGRRDRKRVRAAGMRAPLMHSYTAATTTRVGFLEDWWTHPHEDDPFWVEEDHRESLDTFNCPVLIQAGWYDVLLESSIYQYDRLEARGADVRMTIGPWTHASFASKGLRQVMTETAAFLHAANGSGPALTTPPVLLSDARSGEQQTFDSWPPPSRPEHHHLAPSQLQPTAPASDVTPTTFTYDPQDPTPQFGGALLEPGGGPVDNRELEQRADVVTFDSAPFSADARYIGTPAVELWVSSDVPSPQVLVRLNIVDAKGVSRNLMDRLIAVEADGDQPMRVEATLPPTCVTIAAGESLRLLIAGGAYPRFARNPGTGESPATATTFRVARIGIHHDADHPSRLTLPLTPA